MGVGQGGGETPSRIRISLFFFMTPQGFNKAVFFKKKINEFRDYRIGENSREKEDLALK